MIVSTGFTLFPADAKPQYGYGRFQNVITGTQMERLLAPTRPYNTVLRPGDGKVPERIAYVMCTGSRDETVGNPLCSKFCCMYSIKQNQLIMGALPLADVTVHYIDIRAVGKGYDEFFEQAKAMGANFVKGRVAGDQRDGRRATSSSATRTSRTAAAIAEAEYDLVVLAVGVQPNRDARSASSRTRSSRSTTYDYVDEVDEDLNPARTSIPGVFVAGAASGAQGHPRVDPARRRGGRAGGGPPRAHRRCRHDRAAHRRLRLQLRRQHLRLRRRRPGRRSTIKDEPGVVVARRAMFTCSDATQQEIVRRHRGTGARRPRRRLLLAEAAHVHVPRGRPSAPGSTRTSTRR